VLEQPDNQEEGNLFMLLSIKVLNGKALAILAVALLVTLVQGCSYEKMNVRNDAEAAKYDPASTARVRFFSSPEYYSSYQPGAACEDFHPGKATDKKTYLRVYENKESYILWRDTDLRGMKAEDYRNKVIGMPTSKTTEALKSDRLGYDEVVIPVGKPSVLSINYSMHSQEGSASCYPSPVSLNPEAGKDYEVKFVFEKPQFLVTTCKLTVSELSGVGSPQDVREVKTDLCVKNEHYDYETVRK